MNSKQRQRETYTNARRASRATHGRRVLELWGTPSRKGELYGRPSSIAVRLGCNRAWVIDYLRRRDFEVEVAA